MNTVDKGRRNPSFSLSSWATFTPFISLYLLKHKPSDHHFPDSVPTLSFSSISYPLTPLSLLPLTFLSLSSSLLEEHVDYLSVEVSAGIQEALEGLHVLMTVT